MHLLGVIRQQMNRYKEMHCFITSNNVSNIALEIMLFVYFINFIAGY